MTAALPDEQAALSDMQVGLLEQRVLIVATAGRDAALAQAILAEGGVPALACADFTALIEALGAGAGVLCLAEEALRAPRASALVEWLAAQPPWSDLPVLVLTRRSGAERGVMALRLSELLGNVVLLERPFHAAALVGAARAGLRARRRQYDTRQHLFDLQTSAARLEAADRAKNEFLAMLAHELRNPLAPLTNAHRLIERSQALGETDRIALAMAQRQTRQLTYLVDDLLEASRIARGLIELRCERVVVNDAVRQAAESLAHECANRRHELVLELPSEPVQIVADAARLAQIFENLLTNACKYTPDAGRIRVTLDARPDAVEIRVADNGIGIEPAKLDGLFTLFHQIDATLDRARGGLGIGLALVRQLVELHGGSVSVHSDGLRQGACFTVRLPRSRAI